MQENAICPSCGFEKGEKELSKPLCHFCYFRGLANSAKMTYLEIMLGDGVNIKKFTAEELVIEFNKLSFGETKLSTVKKYLVNYKNLRYVGGTSIKDGKMGRPKKVYRITEKGIEILEKYQRKWGSGHSLLLKEKHKKLKFSRKDDEKASAIRGKMLNDPKYKENCVRFLMTQRQTHRLPASPLHVLSEGI